MRVLSTDRQATSHFVNWWPSDVLWWHRFASTLIQVMAWCHQATSHYLSQCPRSVSPYGLTRLQRVNHNQLSQCPCPCQHQWIYVIWMRYMKYCGLLIVNSSGAETATFHYYSAVLLQIPHNRHPIARLWERDMGCLLWIQIPIYVLPQFLDYCM